MDEELQKSVWLHEKCWYTCPHCGHVNTFNYNAYDVMPVSYCEKCYGYNRVEIDIG